MGERRYDVVADDGTVLAVWVEGQGPPLVMVHGSLQDHRPNRTLAAELLGDFTVHALDRRGFGASGDGGDWTIDKEFVDVARVVDHVAGVFGQGVALWGHSFGASCALGAAATSRAVGRLILYEPSLGLTYPPDSIEAMESALATGDREAAAVEVLSGVLDMDDAQIEEMRSTPRWATIVASAHTIPREARAEQEWTYGDQFESVTAPTLFLTGSDSPESIAEATAAAIRAVGHAQVHVLDGHGHLAHRSDPALVAAAIRAFARS